MRGVGPRPKHFGLGTTPRGIAMRSRCPPNLGGQYSRLQVFKHYASRWAISVRSWSNSECVPLILPFENSESSRPFTIS